MFAYLNFPIVLIKTAFADKKDCMKIIIDVGIYRHSFDLFGYADASTMKETATMLGITLPKVAESLRVAENIIHAIDSKAVYVGISKDIIFDYYNNEKTEFQIASFCAFCAVRSIVGKKKLCKTNKSLIHARMFGFNSIRELPTNLSEMQFKYANRYHIDKAIKELELNWHLKLFADHCRGFYLSFEATHHELAQKCITSKKSYKEVKLKELKKVALAKAKMNI